MTEELSPCERCGKMLRPRQKGPHKSGHTRQDNAKYVYDDEKDPEHKHPLLNKTCDKCGKGYLGRKDHLSFCSVKCAQTGSTNSAWAGDSPGYMAAHRRVYDLRGKANTHRCLCGERAQHWANLTGVYEDIEDYAPMCSRCHKRYDDGRKSMGDMDHAASYP